MCSVRMWHLGAKWIWRRPAAAAAALLRISNLRAADQRPSLPKHSSPPHIIPPPPPPSRDICTSAAPLFIWITADVWTLGGIIRAGNMWRGEDSHHGLQSRLHYHFISIKRTLFNFTNQIFINRSAPSTSRIVPDNKTIFDIWCIDQDKAVLFAFYWS